MIAEVASIAQGLGVNIVDIEVAHSIEGESGVLVLVVPVAGADAFDAGLVAAGYHVAPERPRRDAPRPLARVCDRVSRHRVTCAPNAARVGAA